MTAAVAKYALARLVLVALVAAVLAWAGVPVLIAVMIGLVVAMPLAMMLLPRLRTEMNVALAEAGRRRRAQKQLLRAQLRGEPAPEPDEPPGSDQRDQGETDGAAQRPDQHDQAGSAEDGDEVPAPDPAEHPSDR